MVDRALGSTGSADGSGPQETWQQVQAAVQSIWPAAAVTHLETAAVVGWVWRFMAGFGR